MRVLIITYYWPPSGGSGVQRWLKFVKYLKDFDVEPIVFIPKNPSYPITDKSLESEIPNEIEIIRAPIFEPNQFLNSSRKKDSGGFLKSNPNAINRFVQFIRANFFIPDARKFWIKPSVRFLKKYLSEHPVDTIITTGPPHSVHLIGLKLKQSLQVKWIADFRDPWTDIDYFHQLPLTQSSLKKHSYLENKVVASADTVLVVGNSMKTHYEKINSNTKVITNGYDDVKNADEAFELDSHFSLVHVGLMNSDRNPKMLWIALQELIDEVDGFEKDVRIKLIGKLSNEVVKNLSVFTKENLECISYVPHNKVREYQYKAQVLLLAINRVPSAKGIVTGKIFEYLNAHRPILCIGPKDGDASVILKTTNAGVCIDFDDKEGIKNHILAMYEQYKIGQLTINSSHIEQFHRRELTKQLVSILNEK